MTTREYEPIVRASLLNAVTLRGPDIEHVYRCIAELGLDTEERLIRACAARMPDGKPNDSLLKEALDFLRTVSLVGRYRQSADGTSITCYDPTVSELERRLPFRLLLLKRLRDTGDGRNPFQTVHRYLVGKDIVTTTIQELRVGLESLTDGEHSMNEEKLTFWSHLGGYTGLVWRRVKDGRSKAMELGCVPSVELIVDLLILYQQEHGGDGVPLAAWLGYLEQQFFRCLNSQHGVHAGLAVAILALQECGVARLDVRADDPESVRLGNRTVSRIFLVRETT